MFEKKKVEPKSEFLEVPGYETTEAQKEEVRQLNKEWADAVAKMAKNVMETVLDVQDHINQGVPANEAFMMVREAQKASAELNEALDKLAKQTKPIEEEYKKAA